MRVHELRGFAADDLHGALAEAQAVSKGTKCKQFMFSLSLNPPKGAAVGEAEFERAADAAERALGLEGQPRAIVFHEKEGRIHAHVVWSRIDAATMRAVNLPHFKTKADRALARAVPRARLDAAGWAAHRDGGKSPLNFTLAEWQQAKRLGRDPREIKDAFREAWERSDSLKALGNALAERGYFLAQGDRGDRRRRYGRGDLRPRQMVQGLRCAKRAPSSAKPPSCRPSKPSRRRWQSSSPPSSNPLWTEVRAKHLVQLSALREKVDAMRAAHAGERALLHKKQTERWARETQERADRFRAGLRGLWDNITGRARAMRILNEREAIRRAAAATARSAIA